MTNLRISRAELAPKIPHGVLPFDDSPIDPIAVDLEGHPFSTNFVLCIDGHLASPTNTAAMARMNATLNIRRTKAGVFSSMKSSMDSP